MDNDQITLLTIQQIIIDECIRAVYYLRKYTEYDQTNHNRIVTSALTKIFVIQWCQVFGSDTESTHWKSLDLGAGYTPFSKDQILKSGPFSNQAEWEQYHRDMKKTRDQFFAHFDISVLTGYIPSFDKALNILLAYRQWIIDVIKQAKQNGVLLDRNFETNQEFLEEIKSELLALTNYCTWPHTACPAKRGVTF